MKHSFRPNWTVSLPKGIISAAITSRNSVIAIWIPWTVVSRSALMSLSMTFMFDPANEQMNCASARGNRAHAAVVRPLVSVCDDTGLVVSGHRA